AGTTCRHHCRTRIIMVSIGAGREKSNVSAKGTDMQAESAPGSSASVYPELKDRSRSDDRERAVQACYELLSSGHPLSEILDAAKRVANLNKIPDVGVNIETADMPGEARGAASEWDAGEGPLPVKASFADHP